MPHDRFFIDTSFTAEEVFLENDEVHHLHVLRKEIDDEIELINGHNELATAKIVKSEKKRVIVKIIDRKIVSAPAYPIILVQSIVRHNRLDTIFEKGTELGVTTFWLLPAEKSEKKMLHENDLLRLRRITISALKQCGRLDLPQILIKPPLARFQKADLIYPSFFGDTEESAPHFSQVKTKREEGIIFFIGPESGFSEKELKLFESLGVKGVKLHSNILRTDTASLVALSLIHNDYNGVR